MYTLASLLSCVPTRLSPIRTFHTLQGLWIYERVQTSQSLRQPQDVSANLLQPSTAPLILQKARQGKVQKTAAVCCTDCVGTLAPRQAVPGQWKVAAHPLGAAGEAAIATGLHARPSGCRSGGRGRAGPGAGRGGEPRKGVGRTRDLGLLILYLRSFLRLPQLPLQLLIPAHDPNL